MGVESYVQLSTYNHSYKVRTPCRKHKRGKKKKKYLKFPKITSSIKGGWSFYEIINISMGTAY